MDETKLRIVLPPRDQDVVSEGLRELTAAICNAVPDMEMGYGLGGENGYGANFENEIFQMHRYCWCEQSDCPWCAGCFCVDDGAKCAWCSGEHRWADKGALAPAEPPHLGAPHFWHKSSGLRVWWYKWIGRDNEVFGGGDVNAILADCRRSLPAPHE